jgi:hypothetical protein
VYLQRSLAAGLVALLYGLLSLTAYLVAFRQLEGSRSLLLPRTRAMLKELFQWQDEPKDS